MLLFFFIYLNKKIIICVNRTYKWGTKFINTKYLPKFFYVIAK